MPAELDRLCAEREALYAETERLERGGASVEALKARRARLAEVLHQINRLTDNAGES